MLCTAEWLLAIIMNKIKKAQNTKVNIVKYRITIGNDNEERATEKHNQVNLGKSDKNIKPW